MHYLTIHCKTDIADEKKFRFEIVQLLSSCLWGYHDWGFFNAWTSIYKWNTSNCIQNTFGVSLFRIELSCVSLFEIKVHVWKFGQHHFFLTRKCQDYPSLWNFLFHCSTFSHTICDSKQMSTYENVIFTKNRTLFTLSTVLYVHVLPTL